jgi:hypothetical protein
MERENKRLPRGEEPLAMTQEGLSKLPNKKSVLGKLGAIVARESVNTLLTWVLMKVWPGVQDLLRGATARQDLPSQRRPGAQRSSRKAR